jgi:integrase
VTRPEVRALLEKIAAHAPIEANRTLATCRKLYNWAISQDLVEANPCAGIPAPAGERQRDRVLSDHEIRTIWKDLDNEEPRFAAIMRLRLTTAQRGGEVAAMERDELDLAGGWWTIPAEKAKNDLAHRVPLAPPATRILERAVVAAGGSSYVFPAMLKLPQLAMCTTMGPRARCARWPGASSTRKTSHSFFMPTISRTKET